MEEVAQQRGGDFLWESQAKDGGWHSETYGALRPGAALTALVLYALTHLSQPPGPSQRAAARRAVDFLRTGLRRRGCIACPDGTLDYPVYATSLALLARRSDWDLWTDAERQQMADYLVRAQLTQPRGFPGDHADSGGWDVAGSVTARTITTGTNISLVRFATTALATFRPGGAADTRPGREAESLETRITQALGHARRWLHRCQDWPGDGGFHFSPHPASADNKAEWEDPERRRPRSYGSATCDGLLALIATGAALDDPRVVAARQWLVDHAGGDVVPGFAKGQVGGWDEALVFYYLAAMNLALPFLPAESRPLRREQIVRRLLATQAPDGTWSNASSRMREDDPLIATALAVVTLAKSS